MYAAIFREKYGQEIGGEESEKNEDGDSEVRISSHLLCPKLAYWLSSFLLKGIFLALYVGVYGVLWLLFWSKLVFELLRLQILKKRKRTMRKSKTRMRPNKRCL